MLEMLVLKMLKKEIKNKNHAWQLFLINVNSLFWQGWHKKSKLYFHCDPSSRRNPKSTKKQIKS